MDTHPSRRAFCIGALATFFTLVAGPAAAHRGRHRHPHRRHWRRPLRAHRRIARRVHLRAIAGRRVWVVPVAVAPGWVLHRGSRVVVVKHVHEDRIVVEENGKRSEVDVVFEDDDVNGTDL